MIAYIGVGSNLGDRKKNIEQALRLLKQDGNIRLLKKTKVYETFPLAGLRQGKFLNGVLKIETEYKPLRLLEKLKEIESLLGRKKTKIKWAPREIDLDILFYGNAIIKGKTLSIPHKEIKKRWFVLKPMSDIAPGFRHPALKSTIKVMLREYENSKGSQADAVPGEVYKKRR